jgi:hypothetical protein
MMVMMMMMTPTTRNSERSDKVTRIGTMNPAAGTGAGTVAPQDNFLSCRDAKKYECANNVCIKFVLLG